MQLKSTCLCFCLALTLLLIPLEVRSQALSIESVNEGIGIGSLMHSPAGEEVALVSNRTGASKIWILNPSGGEATLLLDDDASEREPTWSPDGEELAFVRTVDGQSEIWISGKTGGNLQQLTDNAPNVRSLSWSPGGSRLAFMSNRDNAQDVFVVDRETGAISKLTENTSPEDDSRWSPGWSPDGSQIAYVSNRSERWQEDVWVVDVESRATRKLTTDIHIMTSPIWSPDGSTIAFNGVDRSEFWYGDQSDIFVVEMPEEVVRKVEMNTYVSDRNGSIGMKWAPDSDGLFFRYQWEGDDNVWTVPAQGGVATKLTYDEGTFGDFTVSHDGDSVFYVRSYPTRRGEVHRVDVDGGEPVALTNWQVSYPGLKAPKRISFQSYDGLQILGYLHTPPDFDPSKEYPSLVQLHGGGNNAQANGFHTVENILAQNDYVVLAVEYRGSAGHGREFQDLSYGDWATEQGWDAVAAAQFLRSQPYSNGKVGVYGGSYGGIMTMAGLTRDASPFTAAAPLYGIYDWATAYEDGDYLMRFWVIQGHKGFKPEEKPALYRRTATIQHLDDIPTDFPFLIIHGERDRRAPFNQSVRLANSLRERGNPVEFHSYPEERHGFRLPENRLHAYTTLLNFFDTHLK